MKPSSSLFLLGALGALSASGTAVAVDTSNWKCESCPFEKDKTVTATVDAGVGAVSDDSRPFGDYTGLERRGAFLVLGGSARMRGEGGFEASASAADLGLDSRSLALDLGQQGLYRVRFGYAQIPRLFADGAATPFLGNGGSTLTMPAGYDATGRSTTTDILAAASTHPVELGYQRSRLGAGLSWQFGPRWSAVVDVRHDERDGTQRTAGSFFSSSSQLAAPVNQRTDQLEATVSYATPRLQASLAYRASLFRNRDDALEWSNPFAPLVAGADRGQLALAPDNQFHQIVATAGYAITPAIRLSADIATGRMTQDADFVDATLNSNLTVSTPATSLHGKVDTMNAGVRLTADLNERTRVNASWAHDDHDNRTAGLGYPAVTTDMFLGSGLRVNQPFGFTQDRYKLGATYRGGPFRLRTSVGIDQDDRERTLQDSSTTRETKVWARASAQLRDNLSVALKLAHAERDHSGDGAASGVIASENPLLRRFDLAARKRDTVGAHADVVLAEGVNLGLNMDLAWDDYHESELGLLWGRSANAGADLSMAMSDDTRVHAFVQAERTRSRQAGSQVFAQRDWSALGRDTADVAGIGLEHTALKGRLELSANVTLSRLRNNITVDVGTTSTLPTTRVALDTVRLQAIYKLQPNVSLVGSWLFESYEAVDWHQDGVTPAAVANLLAFGDPAPKYRVHVLRLGARVRF